MKKSNYLFALALGVSTLTFAQVGIGTSTPSSPLDIQADDAAIDINNTNAGDGDPVLNFQIGSTTKFSLGVDESDSEKFKIGTTTPDASTAVTVQSTGEVGIGTTAPQTKLQVGETDNGGASAISIAGNATGSVEGGELRLSTAADYDGTYDFYRLDAYNDYFRIGRQGKTDFYMKSNGYCGIGSDNAIGTNMTPATPLEVSSYNATTNSVFDILTLSQVTSGTPAAGIGTGLIFEIQDGGNTEEQGRINVELDDVTNGAEDATMTFDINQNGTMTEVMRIDGTAGFVGIGTSSPASKLHIVGSDETTAAINTATATTLEVSGTGLSTGNGGAIVFSANSSAWKFAAIKSLVTDGSNNTTGDLAFSTRPVSTDATLTEAMRITSAGNVGIGTSSPLATLHVEGTVRGVVDGGNVAAFDRLTSDGNIIAFQQDGSVEGTISVSGSTVSYNAFTGSHYAYSKEGAFERGMLVSFNGVNEHFHNNPKSEILYGINYTAKANDNKVAGVFLDLCESTKELSLDNPYQIMAVGNGDVWVTDEGGDIATGDYLISSSTVGHAMKDNGDYEVSHIFAKATESVDWSTVEPDSNGVKRKKIIVYFEAFDKPNYEKKFREQQAIIEAQKAELKAKDDKLKAELDSKTSTNAEEIEALKAQVQQLLQLIQQQESASVVK